MKILITGSFKEGAFINFYIENFSPKLEIETISTSDMLYSYYYKNWLNRIKFRLGITQIYNKINRELLKKINDVKPDIVWVDRGTEIFPSTLKTIKQQGIKLANFNADHPFIFSQKGLRNQYITDSIELYDVHFCYAESVQKRIIKDYGIPTVLIPFAYSLKEEKYQNIKNVKEVQRVCFVGGADKKRKDFIAYLLDNGIEIDVYGNTWSRYLKGKKGIKIHGAVYGEKFWKTMRKYRVQLNLFREHNEGNHNMRTFEIPAVGGIMLSPSSEEQSKFFEENKEAFFYKNQEDCLQKIKKLLAMNKEEVKLIRESARRKSVVAKYTYEERAKVVEATFLTKI